MYQVKKSLLLSFASLAKALAYNKMIKFEKFGFKKIELGLKQ